MRVQMLLCLVVFAGLEETSQPAGSPHATLFIYSAEQCFSLTTNQPEQYFSAKFQTSERGLLGIHTTEDINQAK